MRALHVLVVDVPDRDADDVGVQLRDCILDHRFPTSLRRQCQHAYLMPGFLRRGGNASQPERQGRFQAAGYVVARNEQHPHDDFPGEELADGIGKALNKTRKADLLSSFISFPLFCARVAAQRPEYLQPFHFGPDSRPRAIPQPTAIMRNIVDVECPRNGRRAGSAWDFRNNTCPFPMPGYEYVQGACAPLKSDPLNEPRRDF